MVDGDAAFGYQLLDIPVGQPVAQVPADRHRDHRPRNPKPANTDDPDVDIPPVSAPQRSANATVPLVQQDRVANTVAGSLLLVMVLA
jgi:hypothetical protein